MRIVSFNVNGLRAFAKKMCSDSSFEHFVEKVLRADILCVQETKGSAGTLDGFHALKQYFTFSSFHAQRGRHGVSTFVRKGLLCEKVEELVKGRVLKTYHGAFVLYNCYLPFLDPSVADLSEKERVLEVYRALEADLPASRAIFCGDLNACYSLVDHYQYYREYKRLCDVAQHRSTVSAQSGSAVPCPQAASSLQQNEALEETHSAVNACSATPPGDERPKRAKREKSDPEVTCQPACDPINGITDGRDDHAQNARVAPDTNNTVEVPTVSSTDACIDRYEKIDPSPRELPYYFTSLCALEKFFFETQQRAWLKSLTARFSDSFRLFNDRVQEYSCWNTFLNNRPVNLGTRIDYVFFSKDLRCTGAGIMQEIAGSDHCPVFACFSADITRPDSANQVMKKNNLLDYFKKS